MEYGFQIMVSCAFEVRDYVDFVESGILKDNGKS